MIFLCFVSILLVLAASAYLHLVLKNPNKDRPESIDDPNGFVRAKGTNLYDGKGKLLQLYGVNLGNWFVQEFWMGVSSVGTFDTGLYTQMRAEAAMRQNPKLAAKDIDELNALYIDNYITESDFQTIAELGMNTVRIPFTWFTISADGKTLREDAFRKLDWAVSMCRKYGLYAILDFHGAVGSQNQDIHSGDDSQFNLYGNTKNEALTCALWAKIADHYKDDTTVAAYDLLNEPRRAPGRFGGKINFDFYDRLYHTVRSVDPNHLILIECFSFPVNGARLHHYDWDNICMEYHIYNLTPFSQKTCLNFYKALHNFMDFQKPVMIGEWNAFEKEADWKTSFAWFDKLGWSFISWTYKANARSYEDMRSSHYCNWGLYELDMDTVDLSTASPEEIREVYNSVTTENAHQTPVYEYWKNYLNGSRRK